MFKNVISPIQAWLMSQGRCVGCGKPLSSKDRKRRNDGTEEITCTCGRIFIYNPKTKVYRRALLTEV